MTVRLPRELNEALKRAARRMQRKPSEVVRLALQEYLHAYPKDAKPADRVRELLGSVESGVPDLAENHRAYIMESLRRGR